MRKEGIGILTIQVQLKIENEEDGSFIATCPQLDCIFVHAETEEDVLRLASDAIDDYFRIAFEHNDPLPDGVEIDFEPIRKAKGRKSVSVSDARELNYTASYAT